MRYSANVIAAVVLSLDLLAMNQAGAVDLPTDAAIKDQMIKQQAATAELLKQSRSMGQAPGRFRTDVPNVTPKAARTEDIGELVKRYQSGVKSNAPKGANDLIVFVSFSMPPEVLKELARQSKETGAVMVLRGFKDGSLEATKRAALAMNKAGAEWDIHPDLFKSFKVTSVPTFAVASAEASSVLENGCAPETTYATVSGDISIELALDTIRRRASKPIAMLAETRLAKIRNSKRPGSVVR